MNYYLFGILLILLSPVYGSEKSSLWECSTQDAHDKVWRVTNLYQKMAINLSYEACKKNSIDPQSCTASKESCQHYVNGEPTTPSWTCPALDISSKPWNSTSYRNREDAALAALAFCKNKSESPETCYVILIACKNLHEGSEPNELLSRLNW